MGEQTTEAATNMVESFGNVGDVIGEIAGASPKVAEYINSMTKMMNMGIDNLAHAGASLADSISPKGVGVGQTNGSSVVLG